MGLCLFLAICSLDFPDFYPGLFKLSSPQGSWELLPALVSFWYPFNSFVMAFPIALALPRLHDERQ